VTLENCTEVDHGPRNLQPVEVWPHLQSHVWMADNEREERAKDRKL